MPNHNYRSKYKTQNKIQNHVQVPEICCSFIQGMKMSRINRPAYTLIKSVKMACETPKQSRVVSQAHNPNQSKGHANKDSNTGNETTDVEDSDKTQSIDDRNEPEEKLLENKNDKNTDASDENIDANANSKEDGDLINHDNETPNTDEYEISVDDNYENFEVVEGYNDENRSTKDDPKHDNVEEENSEDSPTQ